MDALPIPGDISVGLLAMAVSQMKDVKKDHKLFLLFLGNALFVMSLWFRNHTAVNSKEKCFKC